MSGEKAFKNFFKKKKGFPKFKKKMSSNVKMHFVKTDSKSIIRCQRHRIKIPTIGFVRLKEKGYIPETRTGKVIKSGSISFEAGRFYVSCLVEEPIINYASNFSTEGIGIDLGIKDFAILNNGTKYKNINKTEKVKRLEKQLKKQQRCLSRKYEGFKQRKKILKEGGSATRQNISKQIAIVQKLHHRLRNIRNNYVNQIVNEIVKTKPSFITVEDLQVKKMMKNKHLSKEISNQNFYSFREKLINKCKQYSIELRVVDKFYPSSKTCSCCGAIKQDLKLSDRIFCCEHCGNEIDRDLNAAINLKNAEIYKIAI